MILGFKNVLPNLGVALSLSGVPIGMYLNYFFKASYFSEIIMIFSLLLIVDYINFFKLQFYKSSRILLGILFFQIYTLFYVYYSNNLSYLLMHLYFIFLIIFLCSRNRSNFSAEIIILYIFWLSLVTSILGLYFLYNGYLVGQEAWELRRENDTYTVLEVFTVSYGVLLNLICSFYYILKSKKLKIKALLLLIIIVDFYVILFGGKRSPLLVSLVSFLFIFGAIDNIKKMKILVFIPFFIFIAFIAFIYINSNFIDYFISQYENIVLGIMTLIGISDISDKTGSANYRVYLRDWAIVLINENFTLLNHIFGYGYMTKWLDNPLLQSYIDMGVIGFIFYSFFVLFFPLFVYLKNKNNLVLTVFFCFCLYSIVTIFNSGTPYLYSKFIPIIILAYFYFKRSNI